MNDPYKVELHKWHAAIGAFLESMGKIEATTYVILREALPEPMFSQVKSLPLSKRLDWIEAAQRSLEYQQQMIDATRTVTKTIRELIKLRNIVAHNGLGLIKNAPDDLQYGIELGRQEDFHEVTIEELDDAYQQAIKAGTKLLLESVDPDRVLVQRTGALD